MTSSDSRVAAQATSAEELGRVTAAAAQAAPVLAEMSGEQRASLLEAVADALDAEGDSLVAMADAETALTAPRLTGELARTTGQLRLFAEIVREGSYVDAIIDTAVPDAAPPRPDVRRMVHPLGPVGVYSASNFPFAFSVAGGDSASALAVGCPVVVKAHSGHERLSHASADLVDAALRSAGAPEGSFACVTGRPAGEGLVVDPHIRAVGFTGSVAGGRALFNRASTERPDPIPFYGELGSINPVLVTRAAARDRAGEIAQGLVGSFTLGVGQFCTKPGVVLVPDGGGIEEQVAEGLGSVAGGRMLTRSIHEGFSRGLDDFDRSGLVEVLARGADPEAGEAMSAAPVAYTTTVPQFLQDPEGLLEERFGPATLLIRYSSDEDLDAVLPHLPGSLTVTVHTGEGDDERIRPMLGRLREIAGRVVWNGWPTGVAVNRAMHHGGPWPATTVPLHTSVGGTAARRFLRPVAYQDVPDALLPAALRDANPLGILRTVNGEVTRDAVRR